MLTDNNARRIKVVEKSKREQDISINNLVNFIDNIDAHEHSAIVKNYIQQKEMLITYNKELKFDITENIVPVRATLLAELLSKYCTR